MTNEEMQRAREFIIQQQAKYDARLERDEWRDPAKRTRFLSDRTPANPNALSSQVSNSMTGQGKQY